MGKYKIKINKIGFKFLVNQNKTGIKIKNIGQ